MANTLATPSWTMKEVARGYVNDLVLVNRVNRTYDSQYRQNGAKVGDTVRARLPQRFQAVDGDALQMQPLYDQTVPISITNNKQVAFGYTSTQATLELDDIRERYVNPGAEALAAAADVLLWQAVYRDVYQSVGTPGTTPASNLLYLQAVAKIRDSGGPRRDLSAALDSFAMVSLVNANAGLFNSQSKIAEQYTSGQFSGRTLGIDWWGQDSARPTFTTGTFTASTPVTNSAGQTGSSITTSGWASGATSLKRGDIFTIAGVNSINLTSYNSSGRLQQFVLTADAVDTTGTMTLTFQPPIITSGPLQTVDAAPGNNAAITVVGSTGSVAGTLATTLSPQSLVFHSDAFAFVMADPAEPNGGAKSTAVRSKSLGFSIRYVEQYSIANNINASRLDILIGAATVQARLACRVQG